MNRYVGTAKMFPDSRRPRRLATVISVIETNAISIRKCRAPAPSSRSGRWPTPSTRRRSSRSRSAARRPRRGQDRAEVGFGPRRTRRRHSDRRGTPGGTTGHDRQQDARSRSRPGRQEHRRGAAHEQDAQDLLGRVGGRRDRIRAEDRECLLLRQALLDLGFARQRSPEHDGANSRECPAGRVRAARRPRARPAGPVPCTGRTGRAGVRPGRAGPRACDP